VEHLVHWDDVKPSRREAGHLAVTTRDLGSAVGTIGVGLTRWEIDPGKWSTPAHAELVEEEIFYVLGGSGLSWMDGNAYEIGPGDCLVYRAAEETHTHRAGPDGLDVLAFGMREYPTGTLLPRAGVVRMDPAWVDASTDTRHPWEREAAAGEPEVGPMSRRPPNIVNFADVEPLNVRGVAFDRDLGSSGGSQRTGICHLTLVPGGQGTPHHCHSAEEEIFVVLDGSGTLYLGDDELPVRAGHVVGRPPATGVAHSLRAGEEGMTYLAYGTRVPNDIAYYPRSNKVNFRGIHLIGRIERLDYWEGEPLED
jgi:uncharacterized cupin superfamily protein